ncbi:hypothetical protein BG006_000862 [Podila minutissima]|uniref:F-box domain-containing protein n=1 Tax=Podila minutissima TaxID=64525 RepID=A0A9P5VHJ8_9FUNG|nr:hypothetical protein BG006_000862 [Podila minutissima]
MPPNCTDLQLHNTLQPYFDDTYNHEHISQANEPSDPNNDDNLDPEVYGDFVLRPPRPTARSIHASPLSKPSRIRTPYLPPEIIGLICSFSSPRTIVHSIQRVCRDWHAVAMLYIGQKGLWRFRSQKEEDELLDKMRLGRTNTLIILDESTPTSWRQQLDRTPPYDKWAPALEKFWRAITISSLEQDNKESATTATTAMSLQTRPIAETSLIQNIGKLVLQGQFICESPFLLPMLPHLGRIHTLELLPLKCPRMYLLPILEHCSRLENLTIRNQNKDKTQVLWALEDSVPQAQPLGWICFRLNYFDATRIHATYGVLSDLISVCPEFRSFKVQDFHLEFPLPPLYPMRPPDQATILAQIRPLYRQAASQCLFLEDFVVAPVTWSRLSNDEPGYYMTHVTNDATRHSAHMHLLHEFFPQLRQASFALTMPSPWQPTPALCDYLSQLTHLQISGSSNYGVFNSQVLDVVLRCTKSLVSLIAPEANLKSRKFFYDQEVDKEFKALLAAKRMTPNTKRARILHKRLNLEAARKYSAPIRHSHHPRAGAALPLLIHWACSALQVVDIGVESSSYQQTCAQNVQAVFRQLAHCCPLITDLTIRSYGLDIGQQCQRYMNFIEPEGHRYSQKVVYSRAPNSVLALGGGHRYEEFDGGVGRSWQDMSMLTKGKLVRLRQLCFVAEVIQGGLSVGDFEFLRTKNDARGKNVKRARKEVYWPRLETFSILCNSVPNVIPTPFDRVDARDGRPLVKKLEGLRPGVTFKTTTAIWEPFEAQIATLEQERDAVRQVFQHLVSTPHSTVLPHISTDKPPSNQEWFDDSASESDAPHIETSTATLSSNSFANAPLLVYRLAQDCQGDRLLFQQRLLDSEKSLFCQFQACRAIQLQYTPNLEQQVHLAQCERDSRVRLAEVAKDREVELARIASEERIVLAKVAKDIRKFANEKEIRKTEIFADVRKTVKNERYNVGNTEKKGTELAKVEKDVEQIRKGRALQR